MSLLLVEPPEELGRATVLQLLAEGDEVRVLVRDRRLVSRWKELNAYVAVGDPNDEDLVERACQNVRTIVAFKEPAPPLIAGAKAAGVGRVVTVTGKEVPPTEGIEHVVIVTRGPRPWRSFGDATGIAHAVSAADDLASVPDRPVRLTEPEGWKALNLEPR